MVKQTKEEKGDKNQMKKNLKIAKPNNKGITLIALVVTIVVLLILAGITITALLSDGGIFNTAKRAQTVQDEAAIKEKVQIMLADAQLEKLVNNTGLKAYLTSKGYTVTEDATAGAVTIPVDGYNVTIDEDTLEITGMTKADGSGNEGGTNPPSNPTVAVTGVSLDKETETMTVGGSLTLVATVAPETASNKAVTWTSSVPAVAEVNNGEVSAKAAGSTTITVTTTDGSFTDTCNIIVNESKPTVADLIGKPAASTNTYTVDKYGNKIVIPANFKVVANGNQGVVYDWDKNGEGTSTGEPVVQDGIVIQHETDLNEFVWVPVGEIKNDAVENTTNKTTITLGRYNNYLNAGFIMDTTTTPPTPPLPKHVADKDTYDTTTSNDIISSSYFENTTGTYDGRTYEGERFKTLGNWIKNTLDNRGYYIARYEASYGTNGEADSKPSTGTPLNSKATSPYTKSVGQLYNWVTQVEASTASKAMYPYEEGKEDEVEYYSELVNSYAWDTAIIFIQTYSENTTYGSKVSEYSDDDTDGIWQPANTGERGADVEIGKNTTDKVCNIYDMASNLFSLSTESSTYMNAQKPCVIRGGRFGSSSHWARDRITSYSTDTSYLYSFRTVLDCNAKSTD